LMALSLAVSGLSPSKTWSSFFLVQQRGDELPAIVTTTTTTTTTTTEPVSLLSYTTKRDGYDHLAYFGESPSSYLKYKFLDGYVGVVEPNAQMKLTMFDVPQEGEYYYDFTVCSDTTNTCVTGDYFASDSDAFSFDCTPLSETFTITVSEYLYSSRLATGKVDKSSLMCMYVRREIRSLTDADLQQTMDAMWAMWSIDEATGVEKYGDNFHNYEYLLGFHYFNAAWQESDHIHEGNGFLAQHIKMDMIFEKAIQAVDASISLPYWDYTIESAANMSVWDSPIFTEDTFGTLKMPKDYFWGWLYKNDDLDEATISDGRWKDFSANYNTQYAALNYGYGLMRAPWNMNPSTKLNRFTSTTKALPACSTHYTMLSYTKLSDFINKAPYAPHGAVHIALGGVYGCDAMDSLREAGYISDETGQRDLCKNFIFYMKEVCGTRNFTHTLYIHTHTHAQTHTNTHIHTHTHTTTTTTTPTTTTITTPTKTALPHECNRSFEWMHVR